MELQELTFARKKKEKKKTREDRISVNIWSNSEFKISLERERCELKLNVEAVMRNAIKMKKELSEMCLINMRSFNETCQTFPGLLARQ